MPPFIKAAPRRPPISECDELTGIPILAQKKYAQIMAPSNAENTNWTEITSASIIPFPMVLATGVPKINIAIKLKDAAQTTAHLGDRMRVETIVAIELAASFIPFTKSKMSAANMVMKTNIIME